LTKVYNCPATGVVPVKSCCCQRGRRPRYVRPKFEYSRFELLAIAFYDAVLSAHWLAVQERGLRFMVWKSKPGKLIRVDLREIWKTRNIDFSNWLAEEENLTQLSDEIGIAIRLPEKEAGVGKYSVDILAEEEGTGRKIVIENQLEKTNHDLLANSLRMQRLRWRTLSYGYLRTLREHRERHRLAEREYERKSIILCDQTRSRRINASEPAPKFQIVCKPNEWAKVIKHSSESKDLGQTELKKLNFWTRLKSYAVKRKCSSSGNRRSSALVQHFHRQFRRARRSHDEHQGQAIGLRKYIDDISHSFNF